MTARRFQVAHQDAGKDLNSWLKAHLHLPWNDLQQLVRRGRVFLDGKPCVDPARRLRRGQRVEVRASPRPSHRKAKRADTAKPSLSPSSIRYVDEQIVVVEKPP